MGVAFRGLLVGCITVHPASAMSIATDRRGVTWGEYSFEPVHSVKRRSPDWLTTRSDIAFPVNRSSFVTHDLHNGGILRSGGSGIGAGEEWRGWKISFSGRRRGWRNASLR